MQNIFYTRQDWNLQMYAFYQLPVFEFDTWMDFYYATSQDWKIERAWSIMFYVFKSVISDCLEFSELLCLYFPANAYLSLWAQRSVAKNTAIEQANCYKSYLGGQRTHWDIEGRPVPDGNCIEVYCPWSWCYALRHALETPSLTLLEQNDWETKLQLTRTTWYVAWENVLVQDISNRAHQVSNIFLV